MTQLHFCGSPCSIRIVSICDSLGARMKSVVHQRDVCVVQNVSGKPVTRHILGSLDFLCMVCSCIIVLSSLYEICFFFFG